MKGGNWILHNCLNMYLKIGKDEREFDETVDWMQEGHYYVRLDSNLKICM